MAAGPPYHSSSFEKQSQLAELKVFSNMMTMHVCKNKVSVCLSYFSMHRLVATKYNQIV